MLDRSVLKWGGLSAMVGSVLGLVANVLHPRSSAGAGDVQAELELVAGSGIWLFDHFLIAWTGAFALIGLVSLGWSYRDNVASSWGRLATASAIGGVIVLFVTVLVDGMAVKTVADEWARTGSDTDLATGKAVTYVSVALFTGLQGSFFGLTPVLFGLAGLTTDQYPRGLAWLALIAGLLGLLTASIQYLGGISNLTANVLFPISSLGFTIWIFVMGWRLWKSADVTMEA